MHKIGVNGYINIDHLIQIPAFVEDQEFKIKEKKVMAGGSAANVAYGLSLQAVDSYFLGAVGNDYYADYLLENFAQVKADYLQKNKKFATGTSYALVNPEGLRTMYTYAGANEHYDPQLVPADFLDSLDILHFSSPQLETAFALLAKMDKLDKVQISFDPSSLLTSKGYDYLKDFLHYVDILFLNEDEQAQLFPEQTVAESLAILHELGIGRIFIKKGKDGAFLSKQKPDGNDQYEAEAHKVLAIDSTGAGDAFAVGCLTAIAKEASDQAVLEEGIAMSAKIVQAIGARAGYQR